MKTFILYMIALSTGLANAAPTQINVILESTDKSEAIVETSTPEGLEYHHCSRTKRSLRSWSDDLVECDRLGAKVPNTVEARRDVARIFAEELALVVKSSVKGLSNFEVGLLSALLGGSFGANAYLLSSTALTAIRKVDFAFSGRGLMVGVGGGITLAAAYLKYVNAQHKANARKMRVAMVQNKDVGPTQVQAWLDEGTVDQTKSLYLVSIAIAAATLKVGARADLSSTGIQTP